METLQQAIEKVVETIPSLFFENRTDREEGVQAFRKRSKHQGVVSLVKAANPTIQEPSSNNLIFLPSIATVQFQEGPLFQEGPPDPTIPKNPRWSPPVFTDPYRTAAASGTGQYAGCTFKWFHETRKNGLRFGEKQIDGQKLVLTFDQVSQVQASAVVALGGDWGLEGNATIFHYTLKLYNVCSQQCWQLQQSVDVCTIECLNSQPRIMEPVTEIGQPTWVEQPLREWEEPVGTVTEWWAAFRHDALEKAMAKSTKLGVPLEVREWPALQSSVTYNSSTAPSPSPSPSAK
ncbi:MAG TPA: hypothetical protein VG759_24660 [Candidatus Angelobacter sp.]|nr:hypothetical protein [Candidatus Angelobacter sp.]